ncbi:TPA: quinone oxidoreductase [Raoultella planticola]|uniref:quinone oxidoreductase family protein n=1 Tax=Raoultella planticola TaxID=575 RepID=UPI001A19F639|nr:quinone oxidoreductase [Raoultella planticola]
MKTKAVRVHCAGGPEVLSFETVELLQPGSGQVLIRHTAIGVNLIDTYHRAATQGQYKLPLPATPGVEAVAVVEAVGSGVETVAVGDRVGYFNYPGAYAEKRLIDAWRLIPIPDDIDDKQAAVSLLKGATAFYLLHRIWKMTPGATILVHAAAGGVGQILCRWASRRGVTVIGTAGSDAKTEVAKEAGCSHVINYSKEDFAEKVHELTKGHGVDVVFDSVGRDTFYQSLDCLKPLGMMVNFGQSSGAVEPFDVSILASKGSVFLAKPTLATFTKNHDDLVALADGVFNAIREGIINADIGLIESLENVASVHAKLESRTLTGASILIP